jgi:hypothetical protein
MAGVQVTNNATSLLTAGITASDTYLTITVGDGAKFPNPAAGEWFWVTLESPSGLIEVIKVTTRAGDAFTVVRGQDGTTPAAFAAGDFFDLRPTAALFNDKVTRTSDTGSALVPAGTTAQRDATPSAGMLRWNADFNQFEGYGVGWGALGGATGGTGNPAFYENDTNVTANYTITTGKNAMSAGPITVNPGVVVTVPVGSTWTVV